MTDLEQKRKRIETGVKIAAVLGVGLVAAPFIFLAIKGLVGLIIASAITITTYHFTPWAGMKLANWRLAAIKNEAMRNPVETLQNIYIQKETALNAFLESIKVFGGKIRSFESELEKLAKNYPAELPKFQEQRDQMRQLLKLRMNKYEQAKANLHSFSLEIEKADTIWKVSQAAAAATKAAGMNEEEFFIKIQRETALDSVQESLNLAFSELEIALLDEKDTKKELATSKNLVTDTTSPIPARQQIPTS